MLMYCIELDISRTAFVAHVRHVYERLNTAANSVYCARNSTVDPRHSGIGMTITS